MKRSESNMASRSDKEGAFMAELVQNPASPVLEKEGIFPKKEERAFQTVKQHPAVVSKTKFLIDILGSLLGLLILSPVMGLITVLIKLDSPGPAVFKQERVGLDGKPFEFYKFRSMYQNSSSHKHKNYIEELINHEPKSDTSSNKNEKVYKLTEDERVTRIGRIIRRTSLDELPQLLNVLKCNMSLVGPRPAISYEVDMYKDWYKHRMNVKSGMTGLWQVNGRSECTFDEMVKLDLEYIDNWSLLLDLRILWKTIFVVLKRQGAW